MKEYGPWKIRETERVYEDPFVQLDVDQVVRPDGHDGQHVVVRIKPGVCVLAMDDQQNVYLTREFHYAVGRKTIEAVSGGIEPGDDVLSTAQKELREEIGLVASDWQLLTTVDPFTSIMISPTAVYLATGISFTDATPEPTEIIETVKCKLEEAVAMVRSGEITHAPTCVAILMAAK